jgi:hypothetical protein
MRQRSKRKFWPDHQTQLSTCKGNPPLRFFPYKQVYVIKNIPPPLSLETRAVVDTVFFYTVPTKEDKGSKMDEIMFRCL